jgi:hypothetical protein
MMEQAEQASRANAQAQQDYLERVQASEFASAFSELQELRLSGMRIMEDGAGLEDYRRQLYGIVSRYRNLNPDDVRALLDDGYQVAEEVVQGSVSRTRAEMEEIQGYQRNTALAQRRIEVQNLIVGYENAASVEEQQRGLGLLQEYLNQVVTDKSLDPVGVAFVLSSLTGDIAESSRASAELVQMMDNYGSYQREAIQLQEAYRAGEVGITQYQFEEGRMRERYGISAAASAGFADPLAEQRHANDILRQRTTLHELSEQDFINSQDAQAIDSAYIGELAAPLTDEVAIAAFENTAIGRTTAGRAAIAAAQQRLSIQQDEPQVRSQLAGIDREIAMLRATTLTQFAGMAESGSIDPANAYMIQALRSSGDPNAAAAMSALVERAGRGQLTPQDQQTWLSLRASAEAALHQQRAAIQDGFSQRQSAISPYFSDEAQARRQAYQENLNTYQSAAQASRAQNYVQPAQPYSRRGTEIRTIRGSLGANPNGTQRVQLDPWSAIPNY